MRALILSSLLLLVLLPVAAADPTEEDLLRLWRLAEYYAEDQGAFAGSLEKCNQTEMARMARDVRRETESFLAAVFSEAASQYLMLGFTSAKLGSMADETDCNREALMSAVEKVEDSLAKLSEAISAASP